MLIQIKLQKKKNKLHNKVKLKINKMKILNKNKIF